MRWCLHAQFPLRTHRWGAHTAVYHSGAGDTHLLDELGAVVLAQLSLDPRAAADIVQACLELYPDEPADDLRRAVRRTLEFFEELGLVEQLEVT